MLGASHQSEHRRLVMIRDRGFLCGLPLFLLPHGRSGSIPWTNCVRHRLLRSTHLQAAGKPGSDQKGDGADFFEIKTYEEHSIF
jgi:hypothetical protein